MANIPCCNMCYVRSLLSDIKPNPVIISKVLNRIGRVWGTPLAPPPTPRTTQRPLLPYSNIAVSPSWLPSSPPYSHHPPSPDRGYDLSRDILWWICTTQYVITVITFPRRSRPQVMPVHRVHLGDHKDCKHGPSTYYMYVNMLLYSNYQREIRLASMELYHALS